MIMELLESFLGCVDFGLTWDLCYLYWMVIRD